MMAAQNRKLSELCADLPVYTMVKDKVPLGDTKPETVLAAARRRFPGARLDERDGLHLAWDEGWVHVRASNTEPILLTCAPRKGAIFLALQRFAGYNVYCGNWIRSGCMPAGTS